MKKTHLVMLPGWGMEKAGFQSLTGPLSENTQLSYVEWRNVGLITDFKERVKETVLSFKEPVYLLGWSLGSLAALDFTSEYPKQIKGLILIGGTSRFTRDEDYPSGWQPRFVERMKKQLQRNQEKTLTTFYEEMFSVAEREKGLDRQFIEVVQREFQGDNLDSLCTGLDYLLQTDTRVTLSQIDAPVLLIHGVEDTICPPTASSLINQQLGENAEFHEIENAGHISFFTKSDECIQLIIKFLQKDEKQ
ncbi:alpha/beta hydrolase [Pseudalkalibacillus decolorationis]|uniref:alpha/beta hydrolase n=1 Tax=Pseudalkalibacillus decolorationis TaxID=163879 RepID=UPI0021490BA6|nr:alpha/beta hydrolase [Pseudalkalibacillus decolorationis]